MFKCSFIVSIAICLSSSIARCAPDDSKDQTITELQAKVAALEARVTALEKQVGAGKINAPADGRAPEAQIQQLKNQARARMRKDQEEYSKEQLQQAEQLYQVANKNWRSPEAKTSLVIQNAILLLVNVIGV